MPKDWLDWPGPPLEGRRPAWERVLAIVCLCVITWWSLWFLAGGNRRKDRFAGPAFNRSRVMEINAAVEQFHITFDRWPTNLAELTNNSKGVFFYDRELKDRYNRAFVYEPPAKSVPGRIGSFGADGVVGGKGVNEDYFISVPQ